MKKFYCILLASVVFLTVLLGGLCAYAYDVTPLSAKGLISTESGSLNMRSGPGSTYEKIGTVPKNVYVDVTGKANAEDRQVWYQIAYQGTTGFVSSQYVTLYEKEPEASDTDFESAIASFPDSYKPYLRQLHVKYPLWKFNMLNVNVAWSSVLSMECVTGRSLVNTPTAWKSYEKGAYNWDNGTWYVFDSGNYVQAANEVVAYYLDPRNFLNENDIFQFLLLSDTNVSENAVEAILDGTFMAHAALDTYPASTPGEGAQTYAQALIQAGKEAGISPLFLAARIRGEQGSKGNMLSHGTVPAYEGYFNHFDVGAYAVGNDSAMISGAKYAKNKGWNTAYKAIAGGASFLAKSYINVGQDTSYLQKFDVVDGGNGMYGHQYMTFIGGAYSDGQALLKALKDMVGTAALTFKIPVYKNMPATASPAVSQTGNGNNFLSALSVGESTVKFDRYTYEYELTSNTASIVIAATPADAAAKITGTGLYTLKNGTNIYPITVTASNGLKRTYTVYVTYSGSGGVPDSGDSGDIPPAITGKFMSNVYQVTDTNVIMTIPAKGVALSEFKKNVAASMYNVVYKTASGSAKADTALMCSDDIVELLLPGQTKGNTLRIVARGDVNGDGKISVADLLQTQKHILNITVISNKSCLAAADVDANGKVGVSDLLAGQKKILGI